MPDGKSMCDQCTVQANTCTKESEMEFEAAYLQGATPYSTKGRFTRTHRYIPTVNAMRKWMHLPPITGQEADELAQL